jgi:ABC-type branched-subunit amino acid transport system substrate-binding protein
VNPHRDGHRLRRWARLACGLLALALAGCTAASSSQTVSGKTLYIYLSAPAGAASNSQQQDVLYAEKLAFNQLKGSVTSFKLSQVPVASAKLSDNARQAISNTDTIAYLGEVAPGSSADSIGITNAQDVLQVSPTDTAAELTQTGTAIKGAPTRYYESLSTYGRTFARIVPTTAVEAQAVIGQMKAMGVQRLYLTGDGSEYGRVMAQEIAGDASPSIVITHSAAGSDAVFYAGSSPGGAANALSHAAADSPTAKLFVPSALDDASFVAQLGPGVQRNLYVSSPGVLPQAADPAARKFAADFRSAYGHAPSNQAAFGYAAMAAVIKVISDAGSAANNRSAVVHKFLALSNLPSVVGTFSIHGTGDSTLTTFVIYRVKAGRLVPFKAA